MKKALMIGLVGMFLLAACGSAAGGEGMQVTEYWARAGMMDGNSAAYMLIGNYTGADDALVGASSDAANAVEIHLSQTGADGTMQMMKQEKIDLPAGTELELKPGSYHVMLIGLKRELKAGGEITLTLHFQTHEDVTLTIPVQDAADMGGSGMDGHNTMP
ncbi:MAG: copper chaperone PCu(A)C [Chloroflexi bacterium]|nr:copper chaperone PCu(A)C [Chloroflexota bacterium]MDL1943411.1 copper chaperone PCu(A)C [Chloroflexi bacterium CFX2]